MPGHNQEIYQFPAHNEVVTGLDDNAVEPQQDALVRASRNEHHPSLLKGTCQQHEEDFDPDDPYHPTHLNEIVDPAPANGGESYRKVWQVQTWVVWVCLV